MKSIKDAIKKELVTRAVLGSPPDGKFVMPISPVLSQAAIQLVHRELALKEKEPEEKQLELWLKERKLLLKHKRLLKELEMRHASLPPRSDFDVVSHINLVSPFHEKYV